MAETLGTIRGQMILDVKQALAAYTSARQAHVSTVTALNTGAGAMTASGAVVAGAGVAMAAGILVAVDAAATFEKKLDYFGAVSNSTQAEYDAIREKALQLGADSIYSADQIADSFIELGKSGVGASDIINGIGEAVANLGSAADIPLDAAANIIMSAVQTFGLSADAAVGVADKLAGAANASMVDVTDLGVSLKYAGGVASALGIPFEDLNTAIALLGQYGIRGSTAGTSLRTMMLSLGGATKPAKKALTDLGIITEDGANKFFTSEGKAKSLAEIFQILQDATAGLTDKQKVAALETIFNNRALASAIGLTTEGAAGFNLMAEAIDKTTAAEVAGKRLDNLAGDIEMLRGSIDTLLISSGSTLQSFARNVVQGLTSVVQAFIDLPSGMQGAIVTALAVAAVLLVVIGSIGLFAGAVMNIIALSIQLSTAFGLIRGAMTAFKTALTATAAAQWLLNAAMAANPIGLIIVAIAAVVAALIWFFTSTEMGRDMWSNFMSFLTDAWANIQSFAVDTFTNLSSFFSDVWTNIQSFFTDAINTILDIFFNFTPLGIIISNWGTIVTFFSTLWTNVTTGISNFVTGVVAFFVNLPGQIVAFFQALPGMIGYALGFLLGTVVRIFMQIWTWLTTSVPAMISAVVTFFQELPMKIAIFLIQLYNDAVNWFTQLAVNVIATASSIVSGVIGFFQALPGQVISFFTSLYNGAINWMTQFLSRAISIAGQILNGIVNFLRQLPAMVGNFFQQAVSNVQNFFGQAVGIASRLAQDIFNNIRNGINGLPGLVSGIFNRVVGAMRDAISGAIAAVTAFASGIWEGFKNGLGIHSPSYIEEAMWTITGVIDEETNHMRRQVRVLQGLGNGITELGRDMGDGFGTSIDAGLSTLQASLEAARQMELQMAMGTTTGYGPSASYTPVTDSNETSTETKEVNVGPFYVTQDENPVAWTRAVAREFVTTQ